MFLKCLQTGLARLSVGNRASYTRFFSLACASTAEEQLNRYTRRSDQPLTDQTKAFQKFNQRTRMRDSRYDDYRGSGRESRDSGRGYGGGGGSYGGGFGSGRGGGGGRGGSNANPGSRLRDIDWSRENLKPIQKNFYHEHAAVTRRDQYEIDQWIAANQVTLEGRGIPRPVFEFNEAPYPTELTDLLYAKFQKPTVIQSISWPIAMSGRDIISIAKTGSGKTLAVSVFMLPGIVHTTKQQPRGRYDGPSVLVLLPTRELAQQVQEVSKTIANILDILTRFSQVSVDFCSAVGLKMTCLFGGASKGPQARDLERGVDIVVATPGRLLDFLDNNTTNMKRCSYLVLDEADRMLDMGFEPQIRKIIGQIRPDRQTLMFSATWPKEVRTLASDFQRDAAFLNVGSMELAANHNITQVVDVLDEHGKQAKMMQLLNDIMNQVGCLFFPYLVFIMPILYSSFDGGGYGGSGRW
uniref:Helicase ATP-binding domain-containing protein n=1 Tax=Heterorhabditis bacteriophora TaxID=37862 RepID=A0A1I7XHK3_HETBA